jgi:ABC-type branched-subunit amino acid transport system permease subunit
LLGNELKTPMEIYYFTLFFAVLAIIATMNLVRSRIGRAFVAIRDQDIAAEIIGINIFRYKLLSFAISSFYAGVCGVLFAYYSSIANYEAFQINISIDYLAMIIIGGLGSVLGTILGVIFVQLLPVAIRETVTAYGGFVSAHPEMLQLDSLLRTLLVWGIPLVILLAVRRFVTLNFWTRLLLLAVTLVPAVMTALGIVTYLVGSQFANTSALSAMAASLKLIVFGMLIIFFLVVEPEGLARLWRNIRNYFRVWPFSY